MQAIGFYIGYAFFWTISLLPLRVLYVFADIVFLLIRLIGYRKNVINENLRYSFSELSKKEISRIRNQFYRHFSDLMVETVKLIHMSEADIKRRVQFKNLDIIHNYYKEGKDVVVVLGHYGNWEWIPSFNLHVEALGCDVYHQLKNPYFDKLMLKLRSRWGNLNFEMRSSVRDIVKLRQKNQKFAIGLIADQSPARNKIQYTRPFLNQNTPVILGPEKIAKLTNSPVVFFHMDKVKRGHYLVDIIPVTESPKETEDYEITDKHVAILEEIIKQRPELWLWSHKRWKYATDRSLEQLKKTE